MEIFITLTKYNTHQRPGGSKPPLVANYLVSILPPLAIVSNVFMRIGTPFFIYSAQNQYLFLFGLMSIFSVSLLFLFLCLFCIFVSGVFRGIATSNVSKRTSTGVSFSSSIYLLFVWFKCLLCAIFGPSTKYIILPILLTIAPTSPSDTFLSSTSQNLFPVFCNVCSTFILFGICLSKINLIFRANIISARVMTEGAFLFGISW